MASIPYRSLSTLGTLAWRTKPFRYQLLRRIGRKCPAGQPIAAACMEIRPIRLQCERRWSLSAREATNGRVSGEAGRRIPLFPGPRHPAPGCPVACATVTAPHPARGWLAEPRHESRTRGRKQRVRQQLQKTTPCVGGCQWMGWQCGGVVGGGGNRDRMSHLRAFQSYENCKTTDRNEDESCAVALAYAWSASMYASIHHPDV